MSVDTYDDYAKDIKRPCPNKITINRLRLECLSDVQVYFWEQFNVISQPSIKVMPIRSIGNIALRVA
jgi:hypothetical protein